MPSAELTAYLRSIDAPPAVRKRAQELHRLYRAIADLRGSSVILSEVVADDGSRDFQGLWIFTDQWVMEARFSEGDQEELDGTEKHYLARWVAKPSKFDFVSATPDSRLTVEMWFAGEVVGEVHASGSNCKALANALARHISHAEPPATSLSESP